MKCSVFIATSADGYIATLDGSVDWLHSAGNAEADISDNPDMGFSEFFSSVDCMIIGRKSMEVIAGFNLTPKQWPYGDTKIIVLSRSLTRLPENLPETVEVYSGDIVSLTNELATYGFKHAYIDGGTTITSFLNLKLIDDMTITRARILLGDGIPLFGKLNHVIKLEQAQATALANDFIQVKYKVKY